MRINALKLAFVVSAACSAACLADWYDNVLHHLNEIDYSNSQMQIDVNSMKYTSSDIKNLIMGMDNDTGVIAQNSNYIIGGSGHVGWSDLVNNQYLSLKSLVDGKKYQWRSNSEGNIYSIEEVDPFSNNNEVFFDVSEYATDNSGYYANNIMSWLYFEPDSNTRSTVPVIDQSNPASAFLENPDKGNVNYLMVSKMEQDGYGIDDIRTSAHTQELRDKVSLMETRANSMFNNQYPNNYINWDFSEIGNFFVRAHLTSTNPFVNLKGQFHIKPVQGDFHYEIWHRYFDESNSATAVAYRTCISIVFYIAFALYVMNDLMSIVDA